MGASAVFWTVTCSEHGVMGAGKMTTRWVRVAPPKNKRDRRERGCMLCKRKVRSGQNG